MEENDLEWTESEYNDEVERIMNERARCPVCNATPKKFEPIMAGTGSMVTCNNVVEAHSYVLLVEEDDNNWIR